MLDSHTGNALPTFHNEVHGNIILGIVRTLEFDQVSNFLLTLHKTGYTGTVGFFCDDISEDSLHKFSAMGIYKENFKEVRISIPFTGKKINAYRLFSPVLRSYFYITSPKSQQDFAKNYFHIHQSRHFLYTAFIEHHGAEYKNIMLSDTRDVIFQKDPFDFTIDDSLHCFLEDKATTILSEPHNSSWILRGFGKDILDLIGNNTISCAGITIGSTQAIHTYTSLMCSILLSPTVRNIAGITGLDQGIHNYAIRMGLLDSVLSLHENENGPVLTMGLMHRGQINTNQSGHITNKDGSIVHTLHQYDRHPSLLEAFPQFLLHR